MNKEYIKELFNEYQQNFIDSGYDMETPEDLEDFMESIIISNMEYDFHIYPDVNKLFNKSKEITKEISNEEMDIEK